MYELVDQTGKVIGTMEIKGDISDHPGSKLIEAADTDKSFTFESDGKRWTGIRIRTVKDDNS